MNDNDDDYVPSPREPYEISVVGVQLTPDHIEGMWMLFNHMWGGATVSTQSAHVRKWIKEQERR